MNVVERAQQLADEVLFPAALATDAADAAPVELLDQLAAAGFYGLEGVDFPTVCAIVEALASGCLTTTFVWVQHIGAARAASMSENRAMADCVPLLTSASVGRGWRSGVRYRESR